MEICNTKMKPKPEKEIKGLNPALKDEDPRLRVTNTQLFESLAITNETKSGGSTQVMKTRMNVRMLPI